MVIISLGKKGSGKSAALRKLAFHRLRHPARPLVLYHDPACQLRPGAGHVFTSADAARDYLRKTGGLPQLSIFRGVEPEDIAQLAITVHDCTVILDELDRACIGKNWKAPSVRRIVHEGRHERVDLWGTFRSTRNVSEDLLNAADVILLFRHSPMAVYDIQTIAHRIGPNYAEECQRLEVGQFLIWQDD